MRRTRRGGLLALGVLGLLLPALLGAPAQAAPAPAGPAGGTPVMEKATGTPHGLAKDGSFTVNPQAGKALATRLGAGPNRVAAALCAQPSYVQVFDQATGQRLITVAPGNTITVTAFTVLLHQGVVYPNTRAVFLYRWNNDTAGFDYYTTFAEGNCVIRQEPNVLSGQNFPGQTPVNVYVCFIPWEIGQVVCGRLGGFVRTF